MKIDLSNLIYSQQFYLWRNNCAEKAGIEIPEHDYFDMISSININYELNILSVPPLQFINTYL
jgi:hypothetical protein